MVIVITLSKIKDIHGITFNKYEEYIGTGYDTNFNVIRDSYYRLHPGDDGTTRSFSYGCLSYLSPNSDEDILESIITSDVMTGSDYSGTTIELSNYEAFKKLFGEHPGVYDIRGGYSTFAIGISVKWLLNPDNEETAREILNTLDGLSNYPLIDDEELSRLESDLEYEYVTTDGFKYDFIREMEDQHGITITDFTIDQAWDLYQELSERSDTYPVFETNGWPYIDWERLAKSYRIGDLTRFDIPHELTDEE